MRHAIIGAVWLVAGGTAQAATEMSALDFLVDAKSLVGSTVSVKGCTIIGAMASLVMCNVQRGRASIGNIFVDGDTLDRGALRRSLRSCADMVPSSGCAASSITGKVGQNGMGDIRLYNASINWN